MSFKKSLNTIFFALLFFISFQLLQKIQPDRKPSIAFVHLGPSLPSYLPTAISQARLFNPDLSIYLIANQSAIDNLPPEIKTTDITLISAESLPKERAHKKFIKKSVLDKNFRGGFWTFTTERFFYLSSLVKKYRLSHVFHLENDVMLYRDLKELLPVFKKNYSDKIGAIFDNDNRCIPSLLYIPNSRPLELFCHFATTHVKKGTNDMKLWAQFQKYSQGNWIDHLPIVTPSYAKNHRLISPCGAMGSNPDLFSRHFEMFDSVFDAAALGQYLGGIDPRNGTSQPGFINEECIFNPSHFEFKWGKDEQGRKIPLITYQGNTCKINNLHIHSKQLTQFRS